MRTVTITDFYNFRAAMAAFQAVNADHAERMSKANAHLLATADADRYSLADTIAASAKGAATMARATFAHAKAAAALEAATVALMGERRRKGEPLAAYLDRILSVIDRCEHDMAPFLAILTRNGLRMDTSAIA